jgi:putative sterol carrier protein
MSDVPESPKEFFTEYVPARFEDMKDQLEGHTSAGSIVFHVGDEAWHFRLSGGELELGEGMTDDAILQVTVGADDFESIMVEGARMQEGDDAAPENEVMAFRAVTIAAEKANLVRNVKGNVAFHINDDGEVRQLTITPGVQERNAETPDCKLELLMSDFIEMQTGKANPMQLTMSGKMKIVGNPQIPMALSAVFS